MNDVGVIGATGMNIIGTLAGTAIAYKTVDSTLKHAYGKGMKKSSKKGKKMSIYNMY